MLTGNLSPWVLIGFLALSGVVTVTARWIIARSRRDPELRACTLGTCVADLVWMLLMFAALVLGVRYAERMRVAGLGYAALGLGVVLLSLARSLLFHEARRQRDMEELSVQQIAHDATYVLFGIVTYVALWIVLRRSVWLVLLIPLSIGSLLPDLDSRTSVAGRLLPFLSRPLEARLGHGGPWHSVGAGVILALVTIPVALFLSLESWGLVQLGFFSHLVLDTLRPRGTMLFWPLSKKRYFALGSLGEPGSRSERRLRVLLLGAAAILLLAADVGPPEARPVAVLSYEQSVQRYRALQGRNLVFADVDGTWQVTNRRVSARFEILGSIGESMVMLDRYTGRVFRAGRGPEDHLYLNHLTIVAGSSAVAKPAEVSLRDQLLVEALPVVYEMQSEPGLQHVYISGEIVLPEAVACDVLGVSLEPGQMQLRRMIEEGAGRCIVRYLTASELVAMASVQVQAAELVIVATVVTPPAGPTATPLPSPAIMPGTSRALERAERP